MEGKKPSLFRTALQRLSFRSSKKKYNLVIEQRYGADATADSTLIEKDAKVVEDDTKAPHPHTCPSTPSSSWRQKPPPANYDLDPEWKKLRSSLSTANCNKINVTEEGSSNAPENFAIVLSNVSIDTAGLATEKENVEGGKKVARAQSMTVLDMAGGKEKIQVPSNQLMQMNQYQRRVQVSMEKLNVPSWYKSKANPPTAPSTPQTPRWRQSGGGSSSSSCSGWRRHISHSVSPSTASTPERNSTPLSSQRYRSRIRTLSSLSISPSNSSSSPLPSTPSKPVYLGWRSQERLDTGPVYLASPANRLASSLAPRPIRTGIRVGASTTCKTASQADDVKNEIMDITEAILDYCNTPPVVLKDACHDVDESDEDSEHRDDDSGIDRSDDFRQELLNDL